MHNVADTKNILLQAFVDNSRGQAGGESVVLLQISLN